MMYDSPIATSANDDWRNDMECIYDMAVAQMLKRKSKNGLKYINIDLFIYKPSTNSIKWKEHVHNNLIRTKHTSHQ